MQSEINKLSDTWYLLHAHKKDRKDFIQKLDGNLLSLPRHKHRTHTITHPQLHIHCITTYFHAIHNQFFNCTDEYMEFHRKGSNLSPLFCSSHIPSLSSSPPLFSSPPPVRLLLSLTPLCTVEEFLFILQSHPTTLLCWLLEVSTPNELDVLLDAVFAGLLQDRDKSNNNR